MNAPLSGSNPDGIYQPLNHEKSEVRLLKILPSSQGDAMLRCEMVTVPLAESSEYAALSYVWGDPAVTTEIVVNEVGIHVTSNLASALENIRTNIFSGSGFQKHSLILPAFIWADAVCINQTDIPEKGRQVQMMGNIYRRAALVVSWLGLGNAQILLAMSTLNLLAREIDSMIDSGKDLEWLQRFPAVWEENNLDGTIQNRSWMALREFLDLPYWSRTWIVQEMVLAKRLWLMSGTDAVDFECLKTVVFWNFRTIQNPQFQRPSFFPYTLWASIAFQERFSWFVVNTVILLRGYFGPESIKVDIDSILSKLFFDARFYDATNPRDKVYGLLALAQFNIIPDYSKTVRQVYCNFAKEWKHTKNDLNTILTNSGVGLGNVNKFGLPSWVPDFYAVAHRKAHLGHPGKISVTVHEADSKLSGFAFPESFVDADDSLHLYGIVVDDIKKVEGHMFPRDLIPLCSADVSSDSEAEYRTGIPRLQAIFRLLLESAGCIGEGDNSEMHKMVIELLKMITSKANGNDESLVQKWMDEVGLTENRDFADWYADRVSPGDYHQDIAAKTVHETLAPRRSTLTMQVVTRVYVILESCRIFKTSDGYLGLGLKMSLPGDIVCVVKECGYPIILRKVDSHYIFVGICYVLGLMQGEGAKLVETGETQIQRFKIY